jgi:hypothetical protein
LNGTKDDDRVKEEKEIDEVLMAVFFLVFAVVGYVLSHFL